MAKDRSRLEDIDLFSTDEKSDTFDILLTKEFLKDRIIFINSDITEYIVSTITKAIIYLEKVDSKKPITLYISSFGGSSYDTLALCDVMKKAKCPIHTIGVGKVMSAATWILSCGTKGTRKAYSSTRFMLHEGREFVGEERISDSIIRIKENEKVENTFISMIMNNTKLSKFFKRHEIQTMFQKDLYFSAQQAKKWGLIDEII